ncbi:MAG: YlmC/YmxH family sporulation protein [Negativicutes bacterium]|nr:YlmC/YmxH family sporulation protein [Negativicutes bacterium]
MRLSDLAGKEIINLGDGGRLGVLDDCDLCFDAKSGKIDSILLPARGGLFHLFSDSRSSVVPWPAVKRIGDEVIIVDLTNTYERAYMGYHRDRRHDTY